MPPFSTSQISVDSERLQTTLLQAATHHVGEKYLQVTVDSLAKVFSAKIVFITRALDYPTTRVAVIACNLNGFVDEFNLAGTPCELVYQGQPLAVHEGVAKNFPPARESGCESFFGFPFFNSDKHCIGHLGLFFTEPTILPTEINQQLSNLSLRLEAELHRLEMLTQMDSARRKLDFQNQILQMAATHQALDQVLEKLILGIEDEHPEMLCSLMLPNSDNTSLYVIAAPSLPAEYSMALQHVPIRDGEGSCGTAAFTKKPCIAVNIAEHPHWITYCELALKHGLHSCWSQPILGVDNELLGVFAIYHRYPHTPSDAAIHLIDATASLVSLVLGHYKITEALKQKTQKFQLIMQTSPDGLVVLDQEGRFIEVSDGFLRQVGAFSRSELDGTRIWDWHANSNEADCRANLKSVAEQPMMFETSYRRTNGEHWQAEIHAASFHSNGQQLIWASARDITERKRMEAELTRRATIDDLTLLMNRATFMTTLAAEFQRSQRHSRPLSVLMLDIDHFKSINDQFGHRVGDAVLRKTAETCQAALRAEDVSGRLGGEEFGFILPETDETGACEVAEKIRRTVAELSVNHPENDTTISCTCSVGIVTLTGGESDHEELLSLADAALYKAKASGRNRICIHQFLI